MRSPPDLIVPDWPLRWTLALLLVGLAAATWVGLTLIEARRQAEEQAAMASRPGVTVFRVAPATAPPPGVVLPTATRSRRAAAPASAPTPTAGPGEVEVCGIGAVPVEPSALPGFYPIPAAVAAEARQQVLTLAAEAPDRRVRAAALRVGLGIGPAAQALPQGQESVDTVLQDRLARLAVDSDDPLVYALAIDGCGTLVSRPQAGGACQLLGLEQWTRLDPDNAAPWLNQAALAQERGDAGAEAEAVYRAVQAQRVDWQTGRLAGLLLAALPPAVSPAVRDKIAIDAVGTAAAVNLPGGVVPQRHCSGEALLDANRRQVCEQLATLLVERGRSWLDIGLGRTLGERLGWPPTRLEALREETRLLQDHVIGEHLVGESPGSCTAMRRRADWALRVETIGEPAAAREWLRRSGRTLQQLREAAAARPPARAVPISAAASVPLALTASAP